MKDLYTKLKVIQAFAFLAIPAILFAVHGDVLNSISAYAYYTPMTFALSLTLAGALFVYDGFVERNRWSNMYVGLSLFGVVLFPYIEFPILHYGFAGIFFLGSIFNMVYFSSKKERLIKCVTGIGTLFGMAGCFIFDWYSIFWAEWIGMTPIAIHFSLENLGKID
jgi:hypothetical protein